ncbi:solute carrier family 35 member B1 homolog isoform X2 [Ctenocephalides felis]|uniref:solute carrier family 35 member B1 homolog isoform X2 n=1 Tax=Ctenocephalides felis TaxID=7515 RepID=UPI000E6E5815|nr:solute carrier family 35 member B1 homolog isoform X2 [Ctenocephalides felis]
MNENSKFLFYAAGIFVCYFYFVFVQCVVNYVFAKGILYFKPQDEDRTPKVYYASSALTYLLAMVSSNMALQWVPYPTQVVGKAAKPIPVMLLGVLIGHKSYPMFRYLCVLLIVIGVVLFMYKDNKSSVNVDSSFGIGELLLVMSLSMDGLTGAIQDRMRAHKPSTSTAQSHKPPSAEKMMVATNGWSATYISVALLLSGEGREFLSFAVRYPYIGTQLAALAVTGALGQLFIFMMVSKFGPLACSVVTTTRKFFTVLFSVIFLANPLIARQWFGAVLVFTGLFLDMIYGKKPSPKMKQLSVDKN